MTLYGLKNCDTCRKALRALPEAQLHDLRDTPLPDDLLEKAIELFGEVLINRRSTTWRGLSDHERSNPIRDLLRAYPALMKRPLIIADGEIWLGWDAKKSTPLMQAITRLTCLNPSKQ